MATEAEEKCDLRIELNTIWRTGRGCACHDCNRILISMEEFAEAEAKYTGTGTFYGSEQWDDAYWDALYAHRDSGECPNYLEFNQY